jgi:hypothetical protein
MNKGMQFLFKSFGIEITPEKLAMLQALIPQLPAKFNEAAQAINGALANFDARLRALEAGQLEHSKFLNDIWTDLQTCARRQLEFQEVLNGRSAGTEGNILIGKSASGAGRRSGRANSGTDTATGNGGGSNDAGG